MLFEEDDFYAHFTCEEIEKELLEYGLLPEDVSEFFERRTDCAGKEN